MRILVCDNDDKYCRIITEYIMSNLDESSESVVETFNSAKDLVAFCLDNKPDILFLDIELGDINGIEVAKYFRDEFPNLIIVYIFSHYDYVFSCFETEPLSFLKKPIDRVEFNKTFQMIVKKYRMLHKFVNVRWQNEVVNLEIKDICYIEGYNRHLNYHLYNGDSYEVIGKIDQTYNDLKIYGFVKSHQGFIVNMMYVKSINDKEICLKNGETVPLSFRRKSASKEIFYNYINRRY